MFPSGETVDWGQQPGLLGAITRLYQHVMGANQVGTVPTQGMFNPQDYNPVAQAAQGVGMVAHPTQHKMDWLMATAPLAIGAALGAKGLQEYHPDIQNIMEDPNLLNELPPGSFHPKPYVEGKQNIWTHPDAPAIQIQHDPKSLSPFKVLHEGEVQSSHYTFDDALNGAGAVWNSEYPDEAASWSKGGKFDPFIPLKAQKGLSPKEFEPSKWSPDPNETTIENIYNKNSYTGKAYQLLHAGNDTGAQLLLNQFDKSGATWNAVKQAFELDKKKPSVLAQKLMQQVSPEPPPLTDYGLTPMARTASRNPVSGGMFGVQENPQIHDIINAKDSVYHATDGDSLIGILKKGKILRGWGEPLQLKGIDPNTMNNRVSVSRVPRVASKNSRAFSIVLDPKAFKSSPIAETGYRKTKNVGNNVLMNKLNPEEFEQFNKSYYGAGMNRQFEFEQGATQDIGLEHAKGVVADRSAMSAQDKQNLPQIKQMLQQRGIPYKEVSNGREMHTYRAKMSKTPKGLPMFGLAGAATAAAPGAAQLYQQMNQPSQQNIQ